MSPDHSWMSEVTNALLRLRAEFDRVPDARISRFFKVLHLVILHRRWRLCEVDRSGARHPGPVFAELVDQTVVSFRQACEILYIATNNSMNDGADTPYTLPAIDFPKGRGMEQGHQELFNAAFPATNSAENRLRRLATIRRLMAQSGLSRIIPGKRTLEIGCGSAEWVAAYLAEGAAHASGIDFGPETLKMARSLLDAEGWGSRYDLIDGSLYQVPCPDASFDLVGQMGVFHHLEDEESAIREALRVLKPGGILVYATAGAGGIRYALQDAILDLLRDVPPGYLLQMFDAMGVSPEHTFHLCDAFKAVYRRTTWNEIREKLSGLGLRDFVRMPNELDVPDPFAAEKYGDGFMKFYATYSP